MSTVKNKIWGVILGDVVRSKNISPADHKRMTKAILGLGDMLQQSGYPSDSHEILRGDSFQHVFSTTDTIIKAALLIRTHMKSIDLLSSPPLDVRIGIGLGPVEFKGKSQHESDGTAYWNASKALEKATQNPLANMWIQTDNLLMDEHLNAVLVAWEPIISRWTVAQAKSMKGSLQGKVHQDIGKQLKISQPSVSRSLQSAHDKVIQYLLSYCQKQISGFIA